KTMKFILKIIISLVVVSILIFGCVFILRTSNSFSIVNDSQTQDFVREVPVDIKKIEIKPKEDIEIKMITVGDIMLSRMVEQKMIGYNDYKYPFLKTAEVTNKADIVFGNLETTIIEGRIIKSGEMIFRTDPKAIEGLKFAGFNILSIANNHIMNFGKAGLESTIRNLDKNNISHIGAGVGIKDIYKLVRKDIKGTKFAFLGFTYNSDQRRSSDGKIYGVANMEIEKMKENVGKAKLENDVVIVSMHAGTEYKVSSSLFQENFARCAIDAGADLVIGGHPHVVQNIEKYKEGYIFYSLGNFVFDQMWSNETRLGVIAEIVFKDKKIDNINFIPIKSYDYSQPAILEGVEAEMILERLKLKLTL
ncbi:MAG: CapA family protein, partial [Patescibacteria group bacterium]|nr:CapA family protein [Patescibacteria group bacterium]